METLRIEQVKLLLANTASSMLAVPLLVLVLFFGLSNDVNRVALALWSAAVVLLRLLAILHARRQRGAPLSLELAERIIRLRLVLNTAQGFVWGCLPWITLDAATPEEQMLVMVSLACMLVGTMSLNAPLPITGIAYCVPLLAMVAAKLWTSDDSAFRFASVAGIVFTGTLILQARNMSQAARNAIEMRAENLQLIDRLRIESSRAEAARAEAERANAAKSRFLAAASHDLRQPMHAQGLFLEALSQTELAVHQRQMLSYLQDASRSVAGMLDTLLDFSRIEAGVIRPSRRDFRLQPLFHKLESEFGLQADAKDLTYRSRESASAAHSDPAMVELILRNLISNAIRYTDHGGLLVACRRRGNSACIEVWDTGVGIAAADQDAVFEEFHQLDNPERDRRKGMGLGLAICRGLANALGHALSLSSVPGRGTRFRLELPLAQGQVIDEPRQTAPGFSQRLEARVLVVDDDEVVRQGMQQLLRSWGCDCVVTESIDQAVELALRMRPDLVICDYRLREQRTGVQAIAALRGAMGLSIPALLITGDIAPERLRDAQAYGVPLLHKPVTPASLYLHVREALQSTAPTAAPA
ncbi:MAG TPA: hybrid sensor histidine kinase/response regulator [Steroidobacteraceae bacterium]|nr:hybrid sensor histidine kinase/response regulator [Steroidobacteraceae bacterium]